MNIGFIGLGIMGRPMAKNLIKAGYALTVYDKFASCDEFVALGAKVGTSNRDVAAQSEIIVTMLPNSPHVEEALLGRKAGDEVKLQLEPENAFGDYKSQLVCFEDRKLFPEQLEAGMTFEGLPAGHATPDMPGDVIYVVTEIFPSHVVLDGNHPLAGIALRLTIQVRAVRDASDEETEARSLGSSAVSLLEAGTPKSALH